MSTLREHLDALLALRRPDQTRLDERQFELQGWLLVTAHLDELVALLDQVARPAPCAARFIGGAWQCDHCGAFSLDAPQCTHTTAQAPEHFADPREGSIVAEGDGDEGSTPKGPEPGPLADAPNQ